MSMSNASTVIFAAKLLRISSPVTKTEDIPLCISNPSRLTTRASRCAWKHSKVAQSRRLAKTAKASSFKSNRFLKPASYRGLFWLIVDEWPRVFVGGGLFERLTAIGVWATRPHLSCLAAKEGESPSLLYSLPFFGSLPLSLIDACARVSGIDLNPRRPSAMKNVSTPMAKTGRARRRVQDARGSSVGTGILWWNLLENENSGWGRRRRSLDQC